MEYVLAPTPTRLLETIRRRIAELKRGNARRTVMVYKVYVSEYPMTYYADQGDEKIVGDFVVQALRRGERSIVVETARMTVRAAQAIPEDQML